MDVHRFGKAIAALVEPDADFVLIQIGQVTQAIAIHIGQVKPTGLEKGLKKGFFQLTLKGLWKSGHLSTLPLVLDTWNWSNFMLKNIRKI